MKYLISILILTLTLASCSDDNNGSDNDPVEIIPIIKSDSTYAFSITQDITYAEGLSHETWNSKESTVLPLRLDAYIPDNNQVKRPAIVFIHGGGFIGGSKRQTQLVNLCKYFASRGWVTFSVDYRLKKDVGTVPSEWLEYAEKNVDQSFSGTFIALYPAHRDAKAAMRWVVANASTYNIDTNYISVSGGSAGAITSITLGISNPGDFTDELTAEQDPTISSTNLDQTYKIASIIDFWGSKVAIDAYESVYEQNRFDSGDPPLLIFHGTEDLTVQFYNAEDLRDAYIGTGVGFGYYPLEGYGHGAWNATVDGKNLSELTFDFIVDQQDLIVE
jgi:para-nitrobenzyl esterase